ncbi:MAG TPA: flagellar biosynthetic protein FliR [Acidimicrobiales bacterium]|nr:flagellar biosynthetic protein FliR [Acidimicrobiales bacterium]
MTIEAPAALIVAFVLGVVRASAWLVLVPPFGTRAVPSVVKVGLAAAVALPAAPRLAASPPSLDIPPLIGAVVLQVAMGLSLGFITLLAFAAVQAAGSLIDLFAGFTVAQAFDPLSGNQTALFGRFYQLLAATLLFAINGHILLFEGFLSSFDVVGLRAPALDELAALGTDGLGTFVVAAVEIAAPLLAALFLTEVALGLLSRAAPHMNVFVLGFPVKILLTVGLVGLALPILPGALGALVTRAVRSGTTIVELFAA